MQRTIEYSPRALKDLDGIWDYIEKELCNPSAAQNTVEGIMDKVDILMSFPEAGAKLEFENGLNSGYRYVSFKNYLAFYRLRSDDMVYIDRVIFSGSVSSLSPFQQEMDVTSAREILEAWGYKESFRVIEEIASISDYNMEKMISSSV